MAQVGSGDTVQIHLTGRLEDGSVFLTTADNPPATFAVGGGQLLEALDNALIGMQIGEKKSVTLPPDEGFGHHRPELQQRVPREALPAEAGVGDQLAARQGEQEIPVWVRDLGEDYAVIDANHPLAGQTVVFDMELVAIEAAA